MATINIRLERSSKIRIRRISKGVRIVWQFYAVLFETGDGVEYLDGTNSLTSDRIVLLAQLKNAKETDEWTRSLSHLSL